MLTGKYNIHIVLPDDTTKSWNSFNEIEKKQIAENITNQAMTMLGYIQKNHKTTDTNVKKNLQN